MIDNIAGTFTLPKEKKIPLVFIAGGIGITPFISMLRYINEQKLNYKITLLYSNRNKESTAFFKELEEIARKNKNIRIILTMVEDPEWQGETRMIDAKLLKDYFPETNRNIYMIAGPPGMVKAVADVLRKLGVDSENILLDNFAGY